MKSKTVRMETTECEYLHSAPVKLVMEAASDNFLLNEGLYSVMSTHFTRCSEHILSLSKHS
jgi:hypothetical protein